eukprot:CAMPEP_0174706364 /NCGR_PEP_ID=MMETSP1094-20130205/9243_1 /TAXON_ID=156173 /ORGANISM="Chrysochromulina brevifilum, Strain UTEX LB 985" /LENGTH=127 /DNA_ID=CAMNT_0015904621 /DNA_START=149 /DNA_END=533 /DNA_ORIENTATION=+
MICIELRFIAARHAAESRRDVRLVEEELAGAPTRGEKHPAATAIGASLLDEALEVLNDDAGAPSRGEKHDGAPACSEDAVAPAVGTNSDCDSSSSNAASVQRDLPFVLNDLRKPTLVSVSNSAVGAA